jgi:hypothetical protein
MMIEHGGGFRPLPVRSSDSARSARELPLEAGAAQRLQSPGLIADPDEPGLPSDFTGRAAVAW